ncbi:oligopeptide/dipeptide ABC transporter ATP-binding protein [Natronococcus sp. A-GB7]|uniref:oligopeptide/dipeptide ABC transporter ATP-binding protein n=1 Tax=Natronococcus sp. A-GB7 TaxID=3037649 RepID=UPI00241F9E0E|nr:oligopeptide/dipeptide ABC transporter ATP-binding protein [Natronococcus sp. A-GB7]MDG5821399.1 ATP-binding cassette domain-containing protein [Natronococcus sp. A-GB7]
MTDETPLLEIRNLRKYFEESSNVLDLLLRREPDQIQAVDDVSLTLNENESIAVIGESGCGKTTLLLTLIGLHDITDGEIIYKGTPVSEFDKADWKDYRSNVQVIFQDPFNALDPKMTIRESLEEPLKIHGIDDRDRRVRDVLEHVELSPPEKYLGRKPVNLSGGEKQRVAIARALIVEPDIILADEPVSMLDASTQAAVLKMMKELIEDFGVSMIYISHDLSTVSYISEHVNVMYLGRIVETAPTGQILADPKHPYTDALVSAVPIPDPGHDRDRTRMSGAPRDPIGLGDGCRFRDRCPAVIPPDHLEIDQEAFREVMEFRELLDRDEIAFDRVVETIDDPDPDDRTMARALKQEYFRHELSGENEATLTESLIALANEKPDVAARRLKQRFESVCETTPAYVEAETGWNVACHHYEESTNETQSTPAKQH